MAYRKNSHSAQTRELNYDINKLKKKIEEKAFCYNVA